ncbi:MAG: DMT family transporter [Acidimicrobiales bacterium]
MSTAIAVPAALCASAFFAGGTALQYRSARDQTSGRRLDARSVWHLARESLASRYWILGTMALAVGLGLHALALHQGPLTLIQPLLITGVLFALPTSRRVGGPPVTARDMRWAVLLVGALALFLVTATPVEAPSTPIDSGPAGITVAVSFAGIAVCLLLARRRQGNTAAMLLGTAAGIALAGAAALLKVSTDLLTHGVASLLGSWELYALIVVGGAGLLLSQLSYRNGPMVASLPAINIANPLASVAIGTAVFDEHFRVGLGPVTIEVLSLAVVLTTTAALSRRSGPPGDRPPSESHDGRSIADSEMAPDRLTD